MLDHLFRVHREKLRDVNVNVSAGVLMSNTSELTRRWIAAHQRDIPTRKEGGFSRRDPFRNSNPNLSGIRVQKACSFTVSNFHAYRLLFILCLLGAGRWNLEKKIISGREAISICSRVCFNLLFVTCPCARAASCN